MRDMSEKVCLIVPCYNEAGRIDFAKLNAAPKNCYFLFVNDGSQDKTSELIRQNLRHGMYILDIKENIGKAEAVRRGFMHLRSLPIFEEIAWVGYWDADLAAPLSEINNFLSYIKALNIDVDAVFGSRVKRLGSTIKRNFLRHLLGRVFTTVIDLTFDLKSYDTQCGAKIFKKKLINTHFSKRFITKWIFDVEIILRMKNMKMIECPLTEWQDIKGSKMSILPTAFSVICDIIKLKAAHRKQVSA